MVKRLLLTIPVNPVIATSLLPPEKEWICPGMTRSGHNLIHPNTDTWPKQIRPKQVFSLATCKVCSRYGRCNTFN